MLEARGSDVFEGDVFGRNYYGTGCWDAINRGTGKKIYGLMFYFCDYSWASDHYIGLRGSLGGCWPVYMGWRVLGKFFYHFEH